jgi:hypothetical protein
MKQFLAMKIHFSWKWTARNIFGYRTRCLWAVSAIFWIAALAFPGPALPVPAVPPPEEAFFYDIHFMWFTNSAEAGIRIRRTGKKRYRAELEFKTKGFIGFLISHQKNHYVSEMDYIPENHHLLSHKFTKTVIRGKVVKRTTAVIDYAKGEIRWEASNSEKLLEKGVDPIPKGVIYEDLLSAFFNLRFGAYGPLKRGKRLSVDTLPDYDPPEKGQKDYRKESDRQVVIRIAKIATEREYRELYERTKEKGLLALVKVPKFLFGQEIGKTHVWFDSDLTPVAVTVEDAILFGDLYGNLRGRPSPAATVKPDLFQGESEDLVD